MNAKFMNISDKYGDYVSVTIDDYRDLNPDGDFEIRNDGIYEDGEQIAELVESYEITTDWVGEFDEPVTESEMTEYVAQSVKIDGWILEVETKSDELRVYAWCDGSDDNTPSRSIDWQMVTEEYGYVVIGELVE